MVSRSLLAILRSQAQIFFQGRWITGLLIVVAFAVVGPGMAAFALLGAVVQSAVSWMVPAVDRQEIVDGKHGFCGALTGAAAFAALGFSFPALVWAIVGSALCMPIVVLMGGRRVSGWGLPAMTAPFCVVSTVGVLLTRSLQPNPAPLAYQPTGSLLDPLTTVLNSMAEVVLLDNFWSGALVLLGLFLAGWEIGLWSVVGAVIPMMLGLALHHDSAMVLNGLDGYSGVLVAIALGAVFLGAAKRRILVAVTGTALTVPVEVLMHRAGLPVYTWPFVLVTWLMLLLDRWVVRRSHGPVRKEAPS